MKQLLFEALQQYAAEEVGMPIVYSSARHPYFFNDLNGDGIADPDEICADTSGMTRP
jgi:hypothetical protein